MDRLRAPLVLSLLALVPAADDDLRDVVELEDGDIVRGRVVQRFEPEELVVAQGGKTERFPWSEVKSISTVNDHLATWFGGPSRPGSRRRASGTSSRPPSTSTCRGSRGSRLTAC